MKYLVWKYICFHLDLIEGMLSTQAPTVHLVTSEGQEGRRKTFW